MNNSSIAMSDFMTNQTQKNLPNLPVLLKVLSWVLILSAIILAGLVLDYLIVQNQWIITTAQYIELGFSIVILYAIFKLIQIIWRRQRIGILSKNKKIFIYTALMLINMGLFIFTPDLFTSTSTATTLCGSNLRSIN